MLAVAVQRRRHRRTRLPVGGAVILATAFRITVAQSSRHFREQLHSHGYWSLTAEPERLVATFPVERRRFRDPARRGQRSRLAFDAPQRSL